MSTLKIVVVYAMLLRDKFKIPTIRIKGCTWDNECVSVAAYTNRFSRNGIKRPRYENKILFHMSKMFKT